MAAGLGFKNFTSGSVLTAADVNGYLNSQTVMVFADTAARSAAITSPQEGMFSYLKDTNITQYYTGSAWANLDTTGMTNPMTTTGDTIYSSSGSTPARLGIGSTGNVLTVSGGVPTWAAPAGGGKTWTLLNAGGTALTGAATVTVSGIDKEDLMIFISGGSQSSATTYTEFKVRFNTDTGNNYYHNGPNVTMNTTWGNFANFQFNGVYLTEFQAASDTCSAYIRVEGCKSTGLKIFSLASGTDLRTNSRDVWLGGYYDASAAITSVSVNTSNGTLDAGTLYIYGA